MFQIKFFTFVSIISTIQASTSDNSLNVQRSPARKSWFLNEIENLEKNVNDPASEVLSSSQDNDAPRAFQPSEHISDLPGHSNNINTESHPWQYRSVIATYPTSIKTIKLYNKRGYIAVNKYGQVYSTSGGAPETKFKAMLYDIRKGNYRVRLQNEKNHKYIAISCNTGIVYSTPDAQNLETVLIYSPNVKNGGTFQSEKCSQGSNLWYLGIKKDGRIKNARIARGNDTGTRFLLINS